MQTDQLQLLFIATWPQCCSLANSTASLTPLAYVKTWRRIEVHNACGQRRTELGSSHT